MYIDSIIIEGFKSYAQRTVITGFHEHFNAITGLNGSGKSNVLDAICFVLGITDLKQVRAQSLQDLVYKKGQAGITKASVQLVFKNTDKKNSPHMYEELDDIIVMREVKAGGGTTYRINGKKAEANQVQQLFHSVQLNVNNPTFLIMQGRITKVLNMKPPEILAMVEEAAGTKMYESKKNNAVKLIEKKDSKLSEIIDVLNNEIEPRMRQLNEEQTLYLTYQKNQQEVDKLDRIVTAATFKSHKDKLEGCSEQLQQAEAQVAQSSKRLRDIEHDVGNLETNLGTLRRKRDQEVSGGLRELEKDVQNKSKDLVTADTKAKNAADNHSQEKEAKRQLVQGLEEMKAGLKGRAADLERETKVLDGMREECKAAEEGVEQAQNKLLASQAGMAGDSGSASFADQLRAAENDLSSASTEKQQAEMRLKHAQAEFKKKKPLAAAAEKANEKINMERAKKQKHVDDMQGRLGACAFDPDRAKAVAKELGTVTEKVRELQSSVDSLQARMANLCFDYADPEPRFDRRKVHGLVARLIRVPDAKFSTALEVAAGGRLYNVIVDSQNTGAKLLKNGKLKHRVTIIPLDKISARTLSPDVVAKAQAEVGAQNVQLALSLVGYPEEVEKAMEYVFGATLVCKDPKAAQAVTFHPSIRSRSVTLDGDVYEPSGTLTGGAQKSSSSVLTQLTQLHEAEMALAEAKETMARLTAERDQLKSTQAEYTKVQQQLELAKHEIELLDETIRSSTHGQQLMELEELERSIADQTEARDRAVQAEKVAKALVAEIQKRMNAFANNREAELKRMQGEVNAAKKALQTLKNGMKAKEQAVQAMALEMEATKADLVNGDTQIAKADALIEEARQVAEQLQQARDEVQAEYDALKDKLDKKRAKLDETDKDIQAMEKQKKALAKEKEELSLELKKLGNAKARMEKELRESEETVKYMYEKHKWIKAAESSFGVAGTAFDFEKEDINACAQRLEKLKEQQKKLHGQVNMKALAMLEDIKKEHEDLLKKKVIVEKDKEKILKSIEELDKKKNEALKKAHTQVNRDFGSIFSTLLPGAQAKLEPPEGLSVLDGLEVRVAFGNTWKESLTELSGGQRSLIALSLILSLLLFKPAPMYILDEIDAALDLSHTQNIGKMLRTHFSHSQFIVVSLKEGMFNNANVLFRVRFVDGTSTVTRYAKEPDRDENPTAASGKQRAGQITAGGASKPLSSRNRS